MNRSARSALPTCQRCLADLACVNRVTFTHRPTLRCRATLPAGVAYGLMRAAAGDGGSRRILGGPE